MTRSEFGKSSVVELIPNPSLKIEGSRAGLRREMHKDPRETLIPHPSRELLRGARG